MGVYVATIGTTGVLGITFLITYFIYSNANLKRLMNEKQTANRRHNAVLLGKTVGIGVIPLTVLSALILIFLFVEPVFYYHWMSADTPDDFKKQIQTLTVEEGDSFNQCGRPVGEYYLNFPENYQKNTFYNLGNGFCGIYGYGGWSVLALKYEDELPDINDDYWFDFIYHTHVTCEEYSDFGITYVNVAHNCTVHNDNVFGVRVESKLCSRYDNGKYEFGTENTCNLVFTFIYLFAIASGITVATCTTVYLVKRKKQNFDF